MTNVNTITRLKAVLQDIDDIFYFEDCDGSTEDGVIIRPVCILDRQQEMELVKIKAKINELIVDIAESEEVI